MRRALWIGGALNVICAVSHAIFPVVLRWQQTLAALSPLDRAITYTLAFHTAVVIAAFAYVSFAHTTALLETNLGRFVCRLVAAFYLLRIVEEWTLFRNSLPGALSMSALCALIAGLYGPPAMRPRAVSVRGRTVSTGSE